MLRSFGKEIVCLFTKEIASVELVNACDKYIDFRKIIEEVKLES